jgi:acetyl esterase/lipase
MPRPGRGMRHVGGLRFGYGAFPSRIGRPHRGQQPRGDTGASRCRRSGGFLAGGWPHGGPIILPRDYGRRPAARSSVLYLLDGCCDSYLSWTRSTDIVPDPIEESIYAENLAFTARLRQLSIPATVDLYDNGTHSWPYWQRELHKAWPVIARALGIS